MERPVSEKLTAASLLTAFGSGVYLGYMNSNGLLDGENNLEGLIKAPIVFGGITNVIDYFNPSTNRGDSYYFNKDNTLSREMGEGLFHVTRREIEGNITHAVALGVGFTWGYGVGYLTK